MKIAFNPSTVAALTTPPNNKDITFDLRGRNIFARGVKFYGTDTNTWRDIKINNVSIGSNILDLRNGSNTTLTNTNGVVTINSTWRPVVDNLTSDSTTSSLSAKQGKVLKALIDGKSNSDHNHDGRYVRYYAVTTLDCNNLAAGLTAARISATNAAHTNHSAYLYISDVGTPFQIQIPDSSIPYIYKRYYGSGKWSGWFKLSAGYADSAGSVAWNNVTGKPSSYTPSAHTHAWNSLTHSSTTENQAILTNGKANGWKLQTLNIARWDNAANNAHSHANKSVLDGITSALVNSWNTAYNFVSNITGTDTDKVINKWEEIVNFLAGITEDNKLNTLLNSKLSIQQLSAKDILTTKTNNALFWVDTKGNASTITTGPFTDHPYALLSVTNYNQNAENHKFFYRSRLAFSSAGDIKVASCHHEFEYQQDETWYNVLTSKNSGINGSTIKLNGTSITVYSSGTADGRYVKKSGDTMQGVLTIDTTNFGALTIKRNDDANGASIQFRGKSSVYGYIGLNNSTKGKQFLRWSSDTSRIYTILDTSSTYISNGKGVINGTTITQVDNATNSTNSTNARKLVNWYSARPTSLNAQFGDGSLRIFYATSSTTEGKPAENSHILHLAWDNTGGYDAQLAVHARSGKVSTRAQNGGTWQPWKTLAFTTDIPSSLKNPYSFNVFGVVYDGSAVKTVTTSTFISQVNEGTSTITDGTMLITSYASNSGFADTNAVNVPYKRKAIHLWEYIKAKTDSLYATKVHNHDGIYVRAFRTSNDNIDSDWGQSFKTFDPVPLGTPPEQNPNISLLSIGENFNRRKQLAFIWNNDNIYYRRRIDSGFTNWRRLAFVDQIPTSLKNPHALTISLNGTSQGPYDGSAAKNINITPGSIGAAVSNHSHDYLVVNSADDKSFNSAYHNFQVLYAGGGNGITGRPANVDAFGLFKFRTAIGWSGQMLLADGGSLYIRSSEDAKMTNTLAWKTILDSSNYSGILDSRYYTESEVNSLLSKKLNTSDFNWTNLPGKLVAGNEFNIVNAGFNEEMWFNYLPINNRNSTATVRGYHFGNGAKGYASVQASGFIKTGSSSSYVLLGDGGHKLEGALNVAYSKYLTGITLTGGNSNNEGYRLIFEKTMGGWDINYGVWAIAFRHSGRGTLNIGFDTTNTDGSTYIYDIRFLGSTASRELTPFRAFYNAITKVFRIYWYYVDYTSGDIAVLRGNMEPHNGTWMTSLPNDIGTELTITYNMADQAVNADTVDGYHATDGRTFNGDINWGSWHDTWSDGTHTHPWYGFDHRYPNTGAYSTTISDYFGMTIKTYNTLLLDCGTLLLNSRNNVGIGTTSPTQKLDVIGNIRATGQIIREGHSNKWVYGRSTALLRETSVAGYHTLWSLKTTDGSWDFGEYNINSDWNNIPVLSYVTDSDYNSGNNATTYQIKFPLASGTVALTSNIPNPTNYYWANVKISASSSTTTSPTVHTLTATRVCAGHNPGIDNSISCSNWFRSSGNTGWYNTTYQGGWYMSDTFWIRAHNGVGIYTSGQIYSSSSIRMSNILLEHTDEINNSANGGIYLNYRNSGNVSLCYGGGNVGIGTTTPSYKLDVNGQMRASGFHHSSVNSDNYILLAGGGYKSFGGDDSTPIFLGCLDLYHGGDGTISSSFYCLGYSVPFTYTRGGNYCKIVIPDTTRLSFYIIAAIASVNYSGGGMDTWVGEHRGDGAWWLHCYAFGWNEVRVKGFRLANGNNDSWWGGNPLYSGNGGANKITVCIFGHVKYK